MYFIRAERKTRPKVTDEAEAYNVCSFHRTTGLTNRLVSQQAQLAQRITNGLTGASENS